MAASRLSMRHLRELLRLKYDVHLPQRGIAQALEGDSVIDPPRIMRLAGTVNFPTQKKLQAGYQTERTSLKQSFDEERAPVTADEVSRAFPVREGATSPVTPEGLNTLQAMRRTLEKHEDIRNLRIADVMTRNPRSIAPTRLAVEAAQIMQTQHVSGRLLVVDESGLLLGALHVDDLLRAGVI